MELLKSILVFLDTHSWAINKSTEHNSDSGFSQNCGNMEHIIAAADYIISLFRHPLEAKGDSISSFKEIVSFERNYLNIEQENYKMIWYKLHVLPVNLRNGLVFYCYAILCLVYLSPPLLLKVLFLS